MQSNPLKFLNINLNPNISTGYTFQNELSGKQEKMTQNHVFASCLERSFLSSNRVRSSSCNKNLVQDT